MQKIWHRRLKNLSEAQLDEESAQALITHDESRFLSIEIERTGRIAARKKAPPRSSTAPTDSEPSAAQRPRRAGRKITRSMRVCLAFLGFLLACSAGMFSEANAGSFRQAKLLLAVSLLCGVAALDFIVAAIMGRYPYMVQVLVED